MNGRFSYLLQFIQITGLVLLIILVGLLMYLSIRKAMNNKHNARYNRRLQQLLGTDSGLQVFLETGVEPRLLNVSVNRRSPIFEALRVRLSISRTELERSRIYEYARNHFHDYYAILLKKRRWSTRVNALLELELFRMDSLREELVELLGKRKLSDTEKFLILRIFASFQMKELLPFLQDEASSLSESQLLQLLLPLQSSMQEVILTEFSAYPLRLQCAMVDALRLRNERSAPVLTLLESLLGSEEPTLRLRAINAIANFGYISPESESKLVASILQPQTDYSWNERQALARLMGSIREEHFIPILLKFLGDESYPVRQTASDSLSRYKSGEEQLQSAALHHPDRFAREMAEETLERKRYEGVFH
ncbi:HEAT repeat domain-containing protein [Paenibacillus tianjinensis]|uniref:HEAT repeat domain-containing protein n=1 Tax=Paenibacillus tianjinensis TaxID=2810347 RepID=A0ABX7L440_9BACL|nr:HEAT repeat domain-containing protein [Paenibacillus tianjinensis]QSF42488.1 HEAT repeat domain-containing protein [Paenibacillus tianjinensis]